MVPGISGSVWLVKNFAGNSRQFLLSLRTANSLTQPYVNGTNGLLPCAPPPEHSFKPTMTSGAGQPEEMRLSPGQTKNLLYSIAS